MYFKLKEKKMILAKVDDIILYSWIPGENILNHWIGIIKQFEEGIYDIKDILSLENVELLDEYFRTKATQPRFEILQNFGNISVEDFKENYPEYWI